MAERKMILPMATEQDYLDRLWSKIINVNPEGKWLEKALTTARREQARHYAGCADALQRLWDLGCPEDLGRMARFVRYEACFDIVYSLEDPGLTKGTASELPKLVGLALAPIGNIPKAKRDFVLSLKTILSPEDDGEWLSDLANKASADEPFGDTGTAVKRLLKRGASVADLGRLASWSRFEACQQALQLLEKSGLREAGEIAGLHELLLGCDPSGKEGRPGSWPLAAAPAVRVDTGSDHSHQPIWRIKGGQAIAFSPDSRLLAIAGASGPAHLYEAATGKELRTCEGLKIHIRHLAFSRDGRRLAVAQQYERLTICEVATGKLLCKARFGDNEVSGLIYSVKTGDLLRSSWTRVIDVLDPQTAAVREPLRPAASTHMIHAMAFFHDGNKLAAVWSPAGSRPPRVNVWSWPEREPLLRFGLAEDVFISDLAVSPDGKILAIPAHTTLDENLNGIMLFDASTGALAGKLKLSRCHHVAFTPEGLIIASDDGVLSIWNPVTQREFRRIEALSSSGEVSQIAVSADGNLLAAATYRGVLVWRLKPLLEGLSHRLLRGHIS